MMPNKDISSKLLQYMSIQISVTHPSCFFSHA